MENTTIRIGSCECRSTNLAVKVIRSALRDAFRDGLIHTNPAERVLNLKAEKASVEEGVYHNGTRKAPRTRKFRMAVFNLFWSVPGQRLSDLARLTWRNLDSTSMEIAFITGKTGKRMRIPIADALLAVIGKMPAGDNPDQPLFPKGHAIITKTGRVCSLSNQFYQLMAEVGLVPAREHRKFKNGRAGRRMLNELGFHCLRHTTTSLLKNAGTNSAVAEEFVGHESPAISRRYTHIETDTMRKAVNELPTVRISPKGNDQIFK